jgi:hypothetical protein
MQRKNISTHQCQLNAVLSALFYRAKTIPVNIGNRVFSQKSPRLKEAEVGQSRGLGDSVCPTDIFRLAENIRKTAGMLESLKRT